MWNVEKIKHFFPNSAGFFSQFLSSQRTVTRYLKTKPPDLMEGKDFPHFLLIDTFGEVS